MRTIKQLTDNKFLNIKEVQDSEHGVKRYQFAERLGVDSIAFICWDEGREQFLLNKEYKPPVNQFVLGAFGGSMDKDQELVEIVIAEVREEAGFEVTEDDVCAVGRVLVSNQMNQYCYLYIVKVDKDDQKERQPENAVEALAKVEWVQWSNDLWQKIEDWKPMAILLKAESIGVLP